MVAGVDGCRLGFLLGLREVELGGEIPMHGLVPVNLFEQSEEVGDSKYEAVIVDEGLGGEFLMDLVLASGDVFDVVDGDCGDDEVEEFEVFVLLGGQFAEFGDHQVEVVDLVAEAFIEGGEQFVELVAGHLGGVA
jgi:hypothetical protein